MPWKPWKQWKVGDRAPCFLLFPLQMTELPILPMAPIQLALEKKSHPNDGAIEHAGLQWLWGREKGAGLIPSGSSPPHLRPSPPSAVPLATPPQVLWVPQLASLLSGLQRKGRLPVSYHATHSKKILPLLSLKGTTFLNGSHFKCEWEGTWASERMKLYSGNFKSQAQTTQRIQSRWWREMLFCLLVELGVGSRNTFPQQRQYSG